MTELSVELLVEGVGATPLPLPPVASVYHLMLLPLATKAVALAVAQYTTGDAAVGLAGVGLTTKAKVAVFPVQSDVAGTTLMVVETTFCELFKALNPAAILPVPATPKPTLVGVDQLNVVLGVAPVSYTHLDVYKRQTFTEVVGNFCYRKNGRFQRAHGDVGGVLRRCKCQPIGQSISCLLYTSRCV